MKIDFVSEKLEKAANGEHDGTFSELSKIIRKNAGKNSEVAPEHIVEVLNDLHCAETCADLPPSMHPHPLKASRKGQFAIDIPHQNGRGKYRVVFTPNHSGDPSFRIDNYKTITKITIVELCCDYH